MEEELTKEEFEKKMSAFEKSKGRIKTLAYFRKIVERTSFQAFVAKMRKRYNIPATGFEDTGRYPFPPEEWKYTKDQKHRVSFEEEVEKMSLRYGFHHLEGSEAIGGYIFYNWVELPYRHNAYALCIINDIPGDKEYPNTPKTQEDDDRLYPIAIRISPEVSLRDIQDFISRAYNPEIFELQQKYKNPRINIGKMRKGKDRIRQRDRFVLRLCEKEGLSIKEITKEVFKEFGEHLDQGYIGKIISNERKKRKEV